MYYVFYILCSDYANSAQVENEAHIVAHYNFIRYLPSLLQYVVLSSLKSFVQLDHQVDISLHLMEVTAKLHYSRESKFCHYLDVLCRLWYLVPLD